ncbi:Lipoprotein-anchoring transpeptidase ErfK/SrfK [Nostoc flagelliforme CCNUN1]|uniref:Lipoprotein-anchoring transpeptidase ErfK/SrfK n=1 Tax=Nostoc flagelliforme CCNUN1 TaxID=2038116 RepID=A0A2K8STT3_9NOSO|nr:L,D-transpeptidase [Nostoc flagelliforme]AUB38866.1 Lipoprotein-anchoring transpeptidase ErfK/SrfK [Nostoc flagelliforme CCNUN1]
MKKLINPDWVRRLQILLTGTALSVIVFTTTGTSEVWANSKNQVIAQRIQTLQKSNKRWIQIDLSKQRLIAWEGDRVVYGSAISSGKKSTPTLTGTFNIQSKFKTTRMRGENYNVPNVPHAMFYQGNYGIHGAYWHKRFGTPVSHGCVNLAPKHAKWLFEWASVGTPVVIQK